MALFRAVWELQELLDTLKQGSSPMFTTLLGHQMLWIGFSLPLDVASSEMSFSCSASCLG